MGLDAVEFIIAVEDAAGIAIPDADACALTTPASLVEYLLKRLTHGQVDGCLEQRAFYRLRRAGMEVLGRPRKEFAPDTRWIDLLHPGQHRRDWELLGRTTAISPWPPLRPWFSLRSPSQRVGDTARTLAATAPAAFMAPTEGWNRRSVEALVTRLMDDELGIKAFRWTDRFVQDLQVD